MNNLIPEGWLPMELQKGPPLPKSMQIYWPWYKPPEVPPEEVPPEEFVPPEMPPEYHYLHIYIVGKGIVTPGSGTYRAGSVITLTAIPSPGYIFDHWSGDLTGTMPMANITMNRNIAVTAYFKAIIPPEAPPEVPPVFTCTICGAPFATQAGLDYHMAAAHPEAPPAPPGVADIRVENLTIEPVEVYVGDQVSISVVAKNYGTASGSKVITCNVNGKVSSQSASLGAGASQAVTFTAMPNEARTYQVSVNGLISSFKAIILPQAEIDMPAAMTVKASGPYDEDLYRLTFSVSIPNRGTAPGEVQLIWGSNYLTGKWEEEMSRIVTIQPGESYYWSWVYDDIESYYKGYFTCELFGEVLPAHTPTRRAIGVWR